MPDSRFRPVLMAAALLAAAFGLAGPARAQTPEAGAPLFPGGAHSLTEVHGDWTVICGPYEDARACVVTQNLAQEQSGQRVLAVEFEPLADGALAGTLVLPFGLALADGIGVEIDGTALGEPLPLAVCYDYGCIADLEYGDGEIDALRAGATLRMVGTIADSGESVAFSISLTGITSALDRATTLIAD